MSTHKTPEHENQGRREIPIESEAAVVPADGVVPTFPGQVPQEGGATPAGKETEACANALLDSAAELAAARAEIQAVRDELAAVNEKYMRKLAEEVNFRKRMSREKDESRRLSIIGFLADVVPVIDDLDRALSHAEDSCAGHLREGVVLIRRQLGQMLESKYGLKRLQAVDQPFDPMVHEAVGVEYGETEEPIVCEEYLPGYTVEERIVRTAKVKVRMPSPQAARGSDAQPASGETTSPAADAAGQQA